MKTARVIITFNCYRNCSYCSNNYTGILSKAIKIKNIEDINEFDEVCITGGEPMIKPELTLSVLKQLKYNQRKFLYSAWVTNKLFDIMPFIDGLHFTLHEKSDEDDIRQFHKLQTWIWQEEWYKTKSIRLYVNQNIQHSIHILPFLWSRLEIKPWICEADCTLPENETLFILEE